MIKIRVWDKASTSMIYDPLAWLDIMEELIDHDEGQFRIINDKSRYILMPCTDLRDKNGKEIYRDDLCIVDHPDNFREISIFSVIYKNGAYRRRYIRDTHFKYPLLYHEILIPDYIQVIGNIYENPGSLDEESVDR